jgi:hypothetical protein
MAPPDEDPLLKWDRNEHDGPMYFACTWVQFKRWVSDPRDCARMANLGLILTVLDVSDAEKLVGSAQVAFRMAQAKRVCCFFADTPWNELEAFIEGD